MSWRGRASPLSMEQKRPIEVAGHQNPPEQPLRTMWDSGGAPETWGLRGQVFGTFAGFLFDLYSRSDIQLYLYSLFTVGTRMVFKIA